METARTGRTRYLVVVSRPRQIQPQQQQPNSQKGSSSINTSVNNAQNMRQQNVLPTTLSSSTTTTTLLGLDKSQNKQQSNTTTVTLAKLKINKKSQKNQEPSVAIATDSGTLQHHELCDNRLAGDNECGCASDKTKLGNCDYEKNQDNLETNRNSNEIEESCLLGIDCNEKTTVGLVLRILADTTIRLDGDGLVYFFENK